MRACAQIGLMVWSSCAALALFPGTATAQEEAQKPVVSDVISDKDFEARLPDAADDTAGGKGDGKGGGGEMQAPLPGIEQYLDAHSGTPAEPQQLPPSSEPQPDGELAQPLPPIESVTVPAATPGEAAAQAESPPAISYTVAIEGFSGTGLGDAFRDLSTLRSGKGKAENAAMVQARAQEDEALAIRLLHANGYFDATALSSLERTTDGNLRTVVTVTPGKQYHLGDIVITARPTTPPDLVRSALPLSTGDPITTDRIESAEANISLMLPQQGYPFVKVGERDIALDGETLTGDYTLPVDTGPRGSFRGVTTSGKLAFDARHVEVIARFDRGDLYDSRKVDDLRKALVATSLFRSVGVEPVRTGEMAPDGTEYVDLQVDQEAGPPRTLAGALGYGTGQGFRAEGTWTHRNLFPPEGALILGAVGGTQEQGVSATFRRSNAGRRDRTVQAGLALNHQDYAAYEAFTATLSGSISRASTPIFQKRWTWSYGFEIITSNETTLNEDTGDTKRLTYFIAALPGQIGYDTSDDLLNPTRGFRTTLRVSPEGSLQGSFSPYVRATFDLSGYYPLSNSLVIAARTRLGTITGVSREDVAPSRRIYAGGGGSVRGFGYQQLGPKDANDDPIGGRSVNEFAVEGRYRFGNYGVVAFVDAGQVYDSSIPKFSDIRYGVGIGGRFYTNFGPFRADIAMPIDRQPGESKFTVYIGIGQAF